MRNKTPLAFSTLNVKFPDETDKWHHDRWVVNYEIYCYISLTLRCTEGFTPSNLIAGMNVLFLVSFHDNVVNISQVSIFIVLHQSFIVLLTIDPSFWPSWDNRTCWNWGVRFPLQIRTQFFYVVYQPAGNVVILWSMIFIHFKTGKAYEE